MSTIIFRKVSASLRSNINRVSPPPTPNPQPLRCHLGGVPPPCRSPGTPLHHPWIGLNKIPQSPKIPKTRNGSSSPTGFGLFCTTFIGSQIWEILNYRATQEELKLLEEHVNKLDAVIFGLAVISKLDSKRMEDYEKLEKLVASNLLVGAVAVAVAVASFFFKN